MNTIEKLLNELRDKLSLQKFNLVADVAAQASGKFTEEEIVTYLRSKL